VELRTYRLPPWTALCIGTYVCHLRHNSLHVFLSFH
jgi:hypothetical protein